jgi:aspartate kinase
MSSTQFSESGNVAETAFEKKRGISLVDVRPGYTQVHVSALMQPYATSRIRVLNSISSAEISLDFLKITPAGLSFIIPAAMTSDVERTLVATGYQFIIVPSRSIVTVHAVNMRDEEGLIASIVRKAIQSGIAVDHVTDMHDRMLIVTSEKDGVRFKSELESV